MPLDCSTVLARALLVPSPEDIMLYWAAVFFIIALVAGVFGFFGLAASAIGIAKVLFLVFLVLAVISLVLGRGTPTG